ncbi:MAG: glucokinase [Ignavibacteria bacterium]
MILAGDCGGTKTELALYELQRGSLIKIISEKYFNKNFSCLEDIIFSFLQDKNKKIEAACIGIAGPVDKGKVVSTNLLWDLDEKILSENLGIEKFKLANDLEAIAASISETDEKNLITIYEGDLTAVKFNKVVIAPGTGLGVAALIWTGNECKINSTESGHTDFAPIDEIQTKLLKYLKKEFNHVSYERIVSGPGLVNIFNFLKSTWYSSIDEELSARMENEDPSSVISDEALKNTYPVCVKSLDIFMSVLGAVSGNMVLNYKATGGVYLGGGIPMKIIEKFKDDTFINSFFNKGRLSYIVKKTPVYVIADESAGTFGAALLALEI